MSPEEIKAFAQGLMSGQSVWYVLMPVVAAVAAYMGAYYAERGKSRAIKETIADIHLIVKEIESKFNMKLADLQAHHQMRMVAADKRLEVLQQAFTHWQQLYQAAATMGPSSSYSRERVDEEIENYKTWLFKHTIYLRPPSRKAVNDALIAAVKHIGYMQQRANYGDQFTENWCLLEQVANIFLQEAELPPFSQADFEQMREQAENSNPR